MSKRKHVRVRMSKQPLYFGTLRGHTRATTLARWSRVYWGSRVPKIKDGGSCGRCYTALTAKRSRGWGCFLLRCRGPGS